MPELELRCKTWKKIGVLVILKEKGMGLSEGIRLKT